MRSIYLLLFLPIILSCNSEKSNDRQESNENEFSDQVFNIDYAEKFKVGFYKGYKKVEVINPWPGANETFTYYFIDKKSDIKITDSGKHLVIRTPVKEIACFSTTHLPYLELLQESEALTGFPTTDFINSQTFRDRVDKGFIKDLGPSNEVNIESLIELNPEVIIAFSMGEDLAVLKKVQVAGLPVVYNADYLESSPLGRAEWIKFISLFFEKEVMADSIFSAIEKSYNEIKTGVTHIEKKPSIITGIVYGDTWFLPGGKNYSSNFFQDAGGDYIWKENTSSGFLKLNFEIVYEKAFDADFWIGMGSFENRSALYNADNRYGEFNAYKQGNVFNYIGKIGETGGNEYFESGYSRPDIVLADLVKILHPEKIHDHQLFYYKKLN